VPAGWPQPKYTFEKNPITENCFILGRYLFYETLLSKDNTISCGSCHLNSGAFSNPGHDVSHGVVLDGIERQGTRNSPGLSNLAWYPSFMHDGSALHIESQPLGPLTNTLEMAEDLGSVIVKLQATKKYDTLFLKAYGDNKVTSERMMKSIAQFMGLLYSYNSKFDHYKRKEKKGDMSEAELRGYTLFQANCNSCHEEPLFTDFEFRNNGLAMNPKYKDAGREHITSDPADRYKFKTPSLRNVELTFPYMHDGTLGSLEECLDHYTNAKKNTTNLDPLLKDPLPLSAQDKKDLVSFLKTLTDYSLIIDQRFADPNY